MSSESLHAPRERLSRHALTQHHAIVSIMEEMDAVDWYRQRADDTDDEHLRDILLHNMREEIEHACMVLEWLRRNDSDWDAQMRTYLFSEGHIPTLEERIEAGEDGAGEDNGGDADGGGDGDGGGFTVGPMKAPGRGGEY